MFLLRLAFLSALVLSIDDKEPLEDIEVHDKKGRKLIKSGLQFKPVTKEEHLVAGESFEMGCPKHADQEILYIYFIKNNTLTANQKRKRVYKISGTSGTVGPDYKGRVREISATIGYSFELEDVNLDDTGYYYCNIHRTDDEVTTDLTKVDIWVMPKPPIITMKEHFFSSDTTSDEKYQQPQDISFCTAERGFPRPQLQFVDMETGEVLTKDEDLYCVPDAVDQRLQNCNIKYTAIVYTQMNRRKLKCTMKHESLRGVQKHDSREMAVWYPPFDMQMKGNLTEKTITCSAIANPKPNFLYKVGEQGDELKMVNVEKSESDFSERFTAKVYISQLGDLSRNEIIYCMAENEALPVLSAFQQVEELFRAEPLLGKIHWIIIAAAGGAFVIALIIIICCCCKRKDKDDVESYSKGRAKANPARYDDNAHTLASNASYDYRQPTDSGPHSNVQEYLKRAASKEKLVEDYEVASNVQSNVSDYMSHVQRSRQLLARSQDNLDHLGVEVNEEDMRSGGGLRREDSFEPFDDHHEDARHKYQGQHNYHHDDDSHLYANDNQPSQNNHYRQDQYYNAPRAPVLFRSQHPRLSNRHSYHDEISRQMSYSNYGYSRSRLSYHDEATPPPPPRYESVNRGDFSSPQLI